jgi:hypothetical protein
LLRHLSVLKKWHDDYGDLGIIHQGAITLFE